MERPSFQFYPTDWTGNTKLRRCSEAARGAWMDILCVLHDCDEYGIARFPLVEVARAASVALRLAKELADKGVLKGADRSMQAYIFTPRHAGKDGDPVVLIPASDGPCWYSSRMVRDEWKRQRRGGPTQFSTENQPSNRSPKPPFGDGQGDGSSSSSSTPSSKSTSSLRSEGARAREEIAIPAWVPKEPWAAFVEMRKKIKAPLTDRAIKLAISKLEELRDAGHEPGAVLDQSTFNDWKALYEIKEKTNGNGLFGRTESRARATTAHDSHLAGIALLREEIRRDDRS